MDAAAEGSSRMAKFACRICGKGFQSETAVRSHEADKHGDRDWKRCFYMFLFWSAWFSACFNTSHCLVWVRVIVAVRLWLLGNLSVGCCASYFGSLRLLCCAQHVLA